MVKQEDEYDVLTDRYIDASLKSIEKYKKISKAYKEQCKLLKEENIKLKEGKSLNRVHDETKLNKLKSALERLAVLDADD